ncbi:MAG: aldehyde ferredoxin oxidoreductase family protein [Myxococcales bacterium]|nr:aldehyde ferredoxin oxidoreductase family protein [Myxococcales bacterium]
MKGLTGTVLEVDLATGRIQRIEIPEAMWRTWLGGAGLAARLFFEKERPDVDSLAPESPLYLFTGPAAGSGVPGTSRFAVCAKSPLTGIWGEATCGGNFAPELKAAGYDGIVIRGKSPHPVYLDIADGEVTLRDARDLWGLDTYQTCDKLKAGAGKQPKVVCIGPAGERLVKFAAVCNDKHDFAGRCGMGAVMGSKNLKAIACRGTGHIAIADEARLKEIKKRLLSQIAESVPAKSLREMGTNATMDLGMMTGDVPIKNYRRGEALEIAAEIGGPAMTEKFLVKPGACTSCPIASKRVMKCDSEPYRMEVGPGPEYETAAAFGSLCENADAPAVLRANELCNRFGMDTISCGATVAFAIDCVEEGILGPSDLGGIDLGWGKAEGILALVEKIARREGLGEVLAEGSRAAARRIGRGAERLTAEVKGLELPMHDPRGWHGLGLAYMMSNRGACHNAHLMHPIEQGIATWTELGFLENYDGQSDVGKGEVVRRAEDFGVPCNSIPLCVFDMWTMKAGDPVDFLNAVTGWDLTLEEYLRIGERTWLQKRALNNLMGVGAADDRLPEKVKLPAPDGGAAGSVPDDERLRRDYYAARGLDERGWPRRETLLAAGLADVAARLYP